MKYKLNEQIEVKDDMILRLRLFGIREMNKNEYVKKDFKSVNGKWVQNRFEIVLLKSCLVSHELDPEW